MNTIPTQAAALCLAFAAMLGLAVAEEPKVLFHVPFDGDSTGFSQDFTFPDIYRSKGNFTGTPFEFGPGVAGEGALFSWKNNYPGVCFPNHHNLDAQKGTISFWIKCTQPVFLNRYYPNVWICFGNENQLSPVAIVPLNDKRLAHIHEDETWHHFAYTWDLAEGARKQFLDGKLLAEDKITKPVDPKLLVFGYRMPGAMDEIVVLDRALSDEEVGKAYAAYQDGQRPFAIAAAPEKTFHPFAVDSKPRPAVPAGVDWSLGEALTSNEKRATYALGGIWRFQPTKSPRVETQPEKWFYVRFPAMWRPGAQLLDANLKKTDFWKPSVDDLAAGAGGALTLGSFPCAWFERDFQVPPGPKNRQYLLRFPLGAAFEAGGWHSVARASDVYVNGKYAGTIFNSEKTLDVTALVEEEGSNRLSILNGRPWLADVATAGFMSVPELEVRAQSAVTVSDMLVVSRVRQNELGVRTHVRNQSGAAAQISAQARILDAKTGKLAATLDSKPLQLEKGADGTREFTFPAQNLETWSPETPQLYRMELVLREGGETIDVAWPVRFGYREVWVENGEIYLNGSRLSIRGKSHNYLGDYGFSKLQIDMLKATGQNADRTLTPSPQHEKSLDVTDEEGWLVFYHVTGGAQKIPSILSRIGNHPSVIAWQIFGNGHVNGPHGHPMQVGGEISAETQTNERAYQQARRFREMDPTGRLVFYYRLGVGGDFRGIMTTLGWGTPIQTIEEWPSHWAKHKQDPLVPVEMQITIPRSHELELWPRRSAQNGLAEHHAGYFGEAAYRKLTRELADEVTPRDPLKNPWAKSEHAMDVMSESFGRVLRSWRTFGINGYLFHVEMKISALYQGRELNRFGQTVKANNSSFLFYVGGEEENHVAKDHNFTSGETIRKSAISINDTFHDVAGEITWEAKTADGARIAGETVPVTIPQGGRSFLPLEFSAPNVETRSQIRLTAKFTGAGEDSGEDSFEATVFPAPKPASADKTIALIDSTGETEAALKKAGVRYVSVNEGADAASLAGYPLLVIGKNSYPAAVAVFGEKLPAAKSVLDGLNVLCLSQRNRYVMGQRLENLNLRQAFIRAKDSPLFADSADADFAHWRGESNHLPAYPKWSADTDWRLGQGSKHGQRNSFGQGRYWHWSNKGMVSTFCFEKPQLGNFRVLMDAGFDLLYTPLVEFQQGRGRIVLSQLDLVDHYGVDPAATRLFHRLLGEYSQPAGHMLGRMAYLGDGRKEELLNELSVDFARVESPPQAGGVVFLDPAAFAAGTAPQLASQVDAFVKNGGTVLVTRSRKAAKPAAPAALAGKPGTPAKPKLAAPSFDVGFGKKPKPTGGDDILAEVNLETAATNAPKADASRAWMLPVQLPLTKRQIFRTTPPATPIFSGLGMSDFYWQGILDFESVQMKSNAQIADSGLIGQISHGKGRIIFVQFEPGDFEDPWQRGKILRIYNTLLTNLGIRSKSPVSLDAIAGEGTAEEWLPGYAPKPREEAAKLPTTSAHYAKPALDFDPYQHHVW